MGYPLVGTGWGIPLLGLDAGTPNVTGWGTPIETGWGYPTSGLGGGTPIGTGWGTPPLELDGDTPPVRSGLGTPPPIRRQNSRTNTCYVAGSVSLAFTQEDFLVVIEFILKAK